MWEDTIVAEVRVVRQTHAIVSEHKGAGVSGQKTDRFMRDAARQPINR